MKQKAQYSWRELKIELENSGLRDLYNEYSCKIRDEYFWKPDGIHGIMHSKRVLMLTLILSYLHQLKEPEIELLASAAVYHDIGRTHDGICYEHGKNSVQKMVELELIEQLNIKELDVFKFIIENHCISDDEALEKLVQMNFNEQNRVKLLFEIFKDSDGLDRVRIGDLNPDYLRRPPSRRLINIAKRFLEDQFIWKKF